MSELPQIDQQQVINKLLKKFAGSTADLTLQVSQLEALSEALRDERDTYKKECAQLTEQLNSFDEVPKKSDG